MIYLTSDGGNTWKLAVTPTIGVGAITSIMMKDVNIGYASVYTPNDGYNLWKTIDGGATWVNHTQVNLGAATSIYATSSALVETIWNFNAADSGGRSLDDGTTFKQIFADSSNLRSNDVDFSDDMNGVVVMGPNTSTFSNATLSCWRTQDGGVNWQRGDELMEAWSVYAVKGTKTFFVMPEGPALQKNQTLFVTNDGGKNWYPTHTFTNLEVPFFTGHIAGQGKTLYVQTEGTPYLGLYRSDDLGASWKNIAGPTNHRDTRFVVTGCNGEVVYAFDTTGGVWKTTDGGDGTLFAHASAGSFEVTPDTLLISSTCDQGKGLIHLTNLQCSEFILDGVTFFPDPYKEFSVNNLAVGNFDLFLNMSTGLPINFITDSNVTRITTAYIQGHYGSTRFDTTVVIVAKHIAYTDPICSLGIDTLFLAGNCSSPARGYFNITNRNCDSIIVDTISFSPDPLGEFSVDTLKNNIGVSIDNQVNIPIRFVSDSDITRSVTIHLHLHSKYNSFDTTLTVLARHSSVVGPIMGLTEDSIYIETRYCQPLRRYIDLSNVNCNDMLIDSVILDPQYPELTIDTSLQRNLFLDRSGSLGIPVLFRTDSNLTRRTTMRIVAHSISRTIDTTIIVVAKHSKAPEPFLLDPKSAKPGDTTLIPVFLRRTQDSFHITHYAFHLSYDGDILTPANPEYERKGTLSALGTVTMGSPEVGGVLCTVDLPKPITQDSNLSLPLIYLRMYVTLSRNYSTPITMNSFSNAVNDLEPLCTTPVSEFVVNPECGDSTLVGLMITGKLPTILSIHPNPNSNSEAEVIISLAEKNIITIDLVDAIGKAVQNICNGVEFSIGQHTLRISTSSLPNGRYMIRMRSADEYITHKEIMILH